MLSYKHGFHAGNFADLHKHISLSIVLQALQRKEKPFCYIDTHAGSGLYDLKSPQAQKNREFKSGVSPLYSRASSGLSQLAGTVEQYLQTIKQYNDDGLTSYPGSPLIARAGVRAQDAMILMELHTSEAGKLKDLFVGDPQVHVHHRDGLEGLVGLVPPEQKRGLVLIDPSYEVKSDYSTVRETVVKAHQRWSSGVFMIWYPLLAEERHRGLLTELQRSGIRKIFHSRYFKAPPKQNGRVSRDVRGMTGSGLLVINPPWKFGEQSHSIFHSIIKSVFPTDRFSGEWLVPE